MRLFEERLVFSSISSSMLRSLVSGHGKSIPSCQRGPATLAVESSHSWFEKEQDEEVNPHRSPAIARSVVCESWHMSGSSLLDVLACQTQANLMTKSGCAELFKLLRKKKA